MSDRIRVNVKLKIKIDGSITFLDTSQIHYKTTLMGGSRRCREVVQLGSANRSRQEISSPLHLGLGHSRRSRDYGVDRQERPDRIRCWVPAFKAVLSELVPEKKTVEQALARTHEQAPVQTRERSRTRERTPARGRERTRTPTPRGLSPKDPEAKVAEPAPTARTLSRQKSG